MAFKCVKCNRKTAERRRRYELLDWCPKCLDKADAESAKTAIPGGGGFLVREPPEFVLYPKGKGSKS